MHLEVELHGWLWLVLYTSTIHILPPFNYLYLVGFCLLDHASFQLLG